MRYSDLDWHKSPSTNGINASMKFKDQLWPRAKLPNIAIAVDNEVHEMNPVEYLIGYCNGPTAIGVAKTAVLGSNQPLTMQFGNWKETLNPKELYVGCVVVVKSYYRVRDSVNQFLKNFAKADVMHKAPFTKLFYFDRLYANTVACEWAVIKKPKLKPSLGHVSKFWTRTIQGERKEFLGVAYDQENEDYVNVYNDHWPLYVKEEVEVEKPVILNWVQIEDEPHFVFCTKFGFQTLIPKRNDLFLELDENEVFEDGQYLGWADTRFRGF